MQELKELIHKLENHIAVENKLNAKVSKVAVGWHIDHSLRLITAVINGLKKSNPDEFKKTFSLKKKILFGLGFFPRGKAKAPKYVRTYEPITENDLVLMVQSAKKSMEEIPSLHPDSFITHPLFGDLKLKETIYFIKLHTKHHLKIMDDILKK
ncbi:MAG: DUF1569 domain-containing protein [Bacteroidetes bacterium]|uniref:DUF1569 domain-containing protein n=1 Tax=Flavobacterium sp. TaxID=239 RepID=UPI002FD93AA5|nr:DUF1569 domain-containing protein [Bacteroidota bacterium]